MVDRERPVTPRSLVIDLLRVTPGEDGPGAAPVSSLVEVASLFGFAGSAVRVAITRLVQSRLVESDERGWYRLAPETGRVNRWVEDWRLGEARIRPWSGAYLAATGLKSGDRTGQRKSLRALARLGFARGLDALFVRPDNLAQPIDSTRRLLEDFGLAGGAELFIASALARPLEERFSKTLWPVKRIRERQRAAIRALSASEKKVRSMPRAQAVVETFLRGGAAIRTLALDPLLPEELMPGDDRRELTEKMLRYDRAGREIWQAFLEEAPLERPPLRAIKGGRS